MLELAGKPKDSTTRNQISKLLSKGADPDVCCNEFGGSALHIASDTDNDIVASALVMAGANLEARDEIGDTPLHDAAIVNSQRVAKVLIEGGADLNAKDERGQTPLHHAAEWGSVDVAKLLIKKGADVFVADQNGTLPSDLICKSACSKRARPLLEKMFMKVCRFGLLKSMPCH